MTPCKSEVCRTQRRLIGCLCVWSCCFVLVTTPSTADTPQLLVPTPLTDVRISGDLETRMERAVAYLDRAGRQQLWSGFERLLTNDHSWGMWGGDWPGRTLEAYARTSLLLGRPSSERFDEVGYGLLAHQARDGSFPNGIPQTPEAKAYHARAGFWFGNARSMLGLTRDC